MLNKILQWLLIFALQVVVFNHLDFSSYLVPQVFILILITLPLHLSKINQILIAFGIGLLADMFVSTPGIHASACLSLIVLRMFLFSRLDLKEQQSNRMFFNVKNVGISMFFYSAIILVVFYQLYVFGLESIGAINWVSLLLTTLFSSTLSLLAIGSIQYISYGRQSE